MLGDVLAWIRQAMPPESSWHLNSDKRDAARYRLTQPQITLDGQVRAAVGFAALVVTDLAIRVHVEPAPAQ